VVALLAPASSVHTRRWAGALASRGHRVVVASWLVAGPIPRVDLRTPRVPRHRRPGRVAAAGSRWLAAARLLATGWWLRRQIRAVRPDVLHVHSVARAGLLSLALPRGIPRVVTPWGSDLRDAASSRLRRWVAGAALRRADLVLPTCAAVTAEVTGRYRVPAGRVATLSWGVDDALVRARRQVRPAAVRAELGVPAAATVVLAVRGTAPVYRTGTILAAFAAAAADRPDLHLVVLAGHRPADPAARAGQLGCLAQARRLAGVLPGRVTVVERTLRPAETFALMCASELAVSVPRGDQRSTAVLEAALAGCRLLLADLPAYRELLADGLVADLLPAPLGPALAGRLRTAGPLGDREQRGNRQLIETSEIWSRQVSAVADWYRRLAAAGPARKDRP
jgi:glycosyltransferase involved in cell wall biosynthesis